MNKKFSTLMASALLATSVGVTAQTIPAGTADFARYVTGPTAGIKNVEKGYVQLRVATDVVLAMEQEGTAPGTYKLVAVNVSDDVEVRNTLWRVVAVEDNASGWSYQLLNLGTGEYLSYNTNNATAAKKDGTFATSLKGTVLGSEVDSWTWLKSPKNDNANLSTAVFGYSFDVDSAITLAGKNLTAGSKAEIVAVKYSVNKTTDISKALKTAGYAQVSVAPYEPAAIQLGVDDLNSMLWRQDPDADDSKVEFTFTPNVINDETNVFGNLFTEHAYKAVPAVGFPAADGVGTDPFDYANRTTNTSIYSSGAQSIYYALEQAEADLQDAKSQLQWMNALLEVCLDENGKIDQDKYNAMRKAMTKVLDIANAAQGKYKTRIAVLDAIEDIQWAEDAETGDLLEQDAKVKAEAIAYIQNTHKFNDYGGTTAMKTAIDNLYKFYKTEFTVGTKRAKIEKNITKNFDKVTSATEIVDDEKAKAKKTFAENAKKNGWVSLLLDEDDKTYLSVDRNFVTETSDERLRPLRFTTGTYDEDKALISTGSTDVLTRLDLNGRYNFQFTWYPSQDSLTIRTAGWAKKNKNQADWTDMNRTENTELGIAKDTDHSKKDTHWERNLVKLEYLTPNHSEITVGSANYNSEIGKRTVNTLIQIKNMDDVYVKTTLEPGVYFLSLVSGDKAKANINDKNLVANFAGKGLIWANEETSNVFANNVQDFEHMPRTQWVIEQNKGTEGTQTVNIYNREFNGKFYAKRVQLYKGKEDGQVFAISYGSNMDGKLAAKDTLLVQQITDEDLLADQYIGYKYLYKDSKYDPLVENVFALKYFNGLNAGNYVEISGDEPMSVNPNLESGMQFLIKPVLKDNAPEKKEYGYKGEAAKQLYKVAYKVQVYAPGKAAQYVMADDENGYVLTETEGDATTFYFKENNELQEEDQDAVCYYALVTSDDTEVSGVKHPSLVLSVEDMADNNIENSIATFAFDDGTNGLYRRLGKTVENDEFNDMDVNNAKFFMANEPTRFLYENSANRTAENGNGVAKDSLNFLGVINIADRPANSALPIFIDTAYVRNNTSKPLYMLAVRTNWVEGTEAVPCPDHGFDPDCPHWTPASPAYRTGSYLVALESDSALVAPNENPIKYQDKYRLAFVEAKHIADTLVIANSKYTGTEDAAKDSIIFTDKKNTVATFAFKIVEGSDGADFYLETANSDGETRYVRVHNGVPVLVENIADAAQFNLTMTDEEATANDEISASEVKVIAGNGQITIAGAAGKKVVVSNILGQVVANTVITSDNATIAAPQGIVVVAVEGEEAVKAIVK